MAYPVDRAFRSAVTELLGTAWRHVPPGIERALQWGGDWYEVSTPFVRWHQGQAVAVVGVIEMPLRVDGRDVVVAGVHGVCTHPAYRGRGHMRAAMHEALAFIDARYQTAILWTPQPEIYTRFGFSLAEERMFVTERSAEQIRASTEPVARALDLADLDGDIALLRKSLARRAPVSDRLATREPGWHFWIDLALAGAHAPVLRHIPALDCIVACHESAQALCIVDVIAPHVPRLEALLPHLGGQGTRVEILFSPDLLLPGPVAEAPHPDIDLCMVRGQPLGTGPAATLSPLVRC